MYYLFIQASPPTVKAVKENIEAEDQADYEASEAYQIPIGNEPELNEVFEDGHEQDPEETLTIRGSDIDYVRANIHCATSIGKSNF